MVFDGAAYKPTLFKKLENHRRGAKPSPSHLFHGFGGQTVKQKMTFQKSSETCVMFSEFFAVHGRGGDALSLRYMHPVYLLTRVDFTHEIGRKVCRESTHVMPLYQNEH